MRKLRITCPGISSTLLETFRENKIFPGVTIASVEQGFVLDSKHGNASYPYKVATIDVPVHFTKDIANKYKPLEFNKGSSIIPLLIRTNKGTMANDVKGIVVYHRPESLGHMPETHLYHVKHKGGDNE